MTLSNDDVIEELLSERYLLDEGDHEAIIVGYDFGMTKSSQRPFARVALQIKKRKVWTYLFVFANHMAILQWALPRMKKEKVKFKVRIKHREYNGSTFNDAVIVRTL